MSLTARVLDKKPVFANLGWTEVAEGVDLENPPEAWQFVYLFDGEQELSAHVLVNDETVIAGLGVTLDEGQRLYDRSKTP